MKRNGFTLTELLIYLALSMFVILAFGRQFKVMVNRYTNGTKEARQTQVAQDILTTMEMDIRNTGLKVYFNGSGVPLIDSGAVVDIVSATGKDSSSFTHKQGSGTRKHDTLTILKCVLNSSNGTRSGRDTIRYFVNARDSLVRAYSSGAKDTTCLAGNVRAFQLEYGISQPVNVSVLNENPVIFDHWTLSSSSGTTPTATRASGNTLNLKFSGTGKGSITCSTPITTVKKNQKYLVTIGILPTTSPTGFLNYMNFMFKNGTNLTDSAYFLPRTDTFQMVIPTTKDVTSGSIAIYYSASGSGNVLFKTLKVTCVDTGAYTWLNNPTDKGDKMRTKAIRVHLLTREETGVTMSGTQPIVDDTVTFLGNYSWRIYDNLIEIPNNGVFPVTASGTSGLTQIDYGIRPTLLSVQN
jgi:hypothetical protein